MLSRLRKADRDYFGKAAGEGSAIVALTAVAVGVMPYGFLASRLHQQEAQYDSQVDLLLDRIV